MHSTARATRTRTDDDSRQQRPGLSSAPIETRSKNDDPEEDVGSLYFKGIGGRAEDVRRKAFAEAFGIGGHRRVRQAMDRLENNIEAGDTSVDIVGFSRGAALAMSFANEIAGRCRHSVSRSSACSTSWASSGCRAST